MEYVTKGTLLGLASGFSPGPLLVLVISETIRHGVKEGIKVSAAPLLTDIPIIFVSLLILGKLSTVNAVLGAVSLAGGFFILYMGYTGLRVSAVQIEVDEAGSNSLEKGIITNALNPHPYVFYMTVGGPIFLRALDQGMFSAAAFFGAFLFSLVVSKVALALATGRSRSFLKGPVYLWIMRGLSICLILFSVTLLREGLRLLGVV
ncbi:MAG: LysE family translocator [Deltaproteobacteria bacterium]|nr:LysE family translocator [Deltaproteobacteria bacterium]